jgi:hypothetical protein
MTYPFFMSYARDDVDSELTQFGRDLCQEVRKVASTEVGDGFIDVNSLRAGRPWAPDVVSALNSSHVLICVRSPRYFRREYCGIELEIFLERRRRFMRTHQRREPGCIIPIPWQPHEAVLTTGPDFSWNTAGLGGLLAPGLEGPASVYEMLISRRDPEYRTYVWRLARRIAELMPRSAADALPPLPHDLKIDGVRSAFEPPLPLDGIDRAKAEGPTAVTFVYSRDPAPAEWPFAPHAQSAIARAALIAKAQDMDLQAVEFDPDDDFVDQVRTARARNTVVVILVHGARLDDDRLCAALRQFDHSFESSNDGIAILVVWNQAPDDSRVSQCLRRFRRSEFFHGAIQTPSHLDRAVLKCLSGLYNRLVEQNPRPDDAVEPLPPIARPTRYATAPQF